MAPTIEAEPAAQATRHALARAAVEVHLDRLTWSAARLAQHQRDELRALLRASMAGSPFHARRLHGIDPDGFELEDLASLPTMTKGEMMANYDEVVTDRRLTRSVVEAHLTSTGWDAGELLGAHVVLASGGSSGERGVYAMARSAAVDYLLAVLRPGLARMVRMFGGLPAEPVPVAIVAAGSAVHATRAMPSLFGGDLLLPTSIAATDPLPSIVDRLNALQPLMLQGYPSVVRRLADEQAAGRLRIAPVAVTATSEPLTPDARARIDEVFGVGVVDLFGSSEGLIGLSEPHDPHLVLATDLTIVELVDERNHPVAPGVRSAKVLLTTLFNRTQPLIRYELTDAFVQQVPAAADGYPRVVVDGRRDDELTWGDLVIHPLAVRTVLVHAQEVAEYQVRQTPSGIDVAVVASAATPHPPDTQALARDLARSLTTAGLADPIVKVEVVDAASLERHPRTGKTRRFLPRSA